MKLTFCAVCGATDGLEENHFIPVSLGGSDAETNKLTLCYKCHGIWHSMRERLHISALTKIGLEKARANGVRLGRLPAMSAKQIEQARLLLASNMNKAKVARQIGVSRPTLYRSLGLTEHYR